MTSIVAFKSNKVWWFASDSCEQIGPLSFNMNYMAKVAEIHSIPGAMVAISGQVSTKQVFFSDSLYEGLKTLNERNLNQVVYLRLIEKLEALDIVNLDKNDEMTAPYNALIAYKNHLYGFNYRTGFAEIKNSDFVAIGCGLNFALASYYYDKQDGITDPLKMAIRAVSAGCKFENGVGYPIFVTSSSVNDVMRIDEDGAIESLTAEEAIRVKDPF